MSAPIRERAPLGTVDLTVSSPSPLGMPAVHIDKLPAVSPQRARAAELCKLASDLDTQMWKSVRGKGIGAVENRIVSLPVAPVAGVLGVVAGIAGACMGFDPAGPTGEFFLGLFGGGAAGALVGSATAFAKPVTSLFWRQASKGTLTINAAKPFVEAYAAGDADTRQMVASLAAQWLTRLDARKTSGEAVRIELQNIVANEAKAGREHGTLGEDVAQVLYCLRGAYGEPLTSISSSQVAGLRQRVGRIDAEMRAEVAVLLDTIMPRVR